MNKDNFSTCSIALVTHYQIYSASQALRDYLRQDDSCTVLYISHPLTRVNTHREDTSYSELSVGNCIVQRHTAARKYRGLFRSLWYEAVSTFIWMFLSEKKYRLYIGVNNVNTFYGLLLKAIGKVEKVVYYTIDYFPTRFENRFLNKLYHMLDKLCVRYADETWNVSSRMVTARQKYNNMNPDVFNRQYTVPIGIWYDSAPRLPFAKINKKKLIFVGHLLDHMGVDLVLRAFPKIRASIPEAQLSIIGGGPEEARLHKLAKLLRITDSVRFYGWVRDRAKLEHLMADGAVGLATFNTDILDDKVRNADPGKIKDYMLLGMPVIATDAISTAGQISKAKCGIIIGYNEAQLVRAVVQLLQDEEKLRKYRENALAYVRQFDYPRVFRKNFDRVLNN